MNCKKQPRIYNSLIKYGIENHTFEVIEECSIKELNFRERYWQDFYDVLGDKGLNCTLTNSSIGKKVYSEKTKIKLSISKKGRPHSREAIDKRREFMLKSNPFKDCNHTDFTKNHLKKVNSKNIFINVITKEVYYGLKDAGKSIGASKSYFQQILKGNIKNRTNIILLEEYDANTLYEDNMAVVKKDNSKKIVNIITMEEFSSLRLAAKSINKSPSHLCTMLKGYKNNNTNLRYKDNHG